MDTTKKKFRAFCSQHLGGLWFGPCRDTYGDAEKDAAQHGKSTGHTGYDVESDVDPSECK